MAKSGAQSGGKAKLAAKAAMWIIIVAIVAMGLVLWSNRNTISGYADVSTSYAARVACSCRFVAGRSLEDCEKDKLGGMELVSLNDDEASKSVTASFPLVTSNTATLRDGYGCVLEEWEG